MLQLPASNGQPVFIAPDMIAAIVPSTTVNVGGIVHGTLVYLRDAAPAGIFVMEAPDKVEAARREALQTSGWADA